MSSFTPGPWAYGIRADGSIWLSLGNRTAGPHYQGDLCASPDDARLIAAAPDLLEAARLCEGICDPEGALIQQVRAAIAKATGDEV